VESIAACLNPRDDIVEKLNGVKIPVLLIHGECDGTWTLEEAEIARDTLPNAELKIIKGGGSYAYFAREADDVNSLIEGFLKAQAY